MQNQTWDWIREFGVTCAGTRWDQSRAFVWCWRRQDEDTGGQVATRGPPAHQRCLGFADRAGRQARGRRGTTEVPGSWTRSGGPSCADLLLTAAARVPTDRWPVAEWCVARGPAKGGRRARGVEEAEVRGGGVLAAAGEFGSLVAV